MAPGMQDLRLVTAVVAVLTVNLVGRFVWVLDVQPKQRSDFEILSRAGDAAGERGG
jgi:hypothetical protein